LKTAESIVDAVWQGGLSTLIAVSLLSFSEAYVFRILYRVISFVVITGIFYGTLFLPVVLSIFNPRPYIFEKEEISDKKSIETFKETQKY
jgi:Niemann-Pick C1 protein